MREVKLGKDAGGTTRPMINGKFRFLAGFLDQSYWPDGIYLAPGDEALASDVTVPSPGSQYMAYIDSNQGSIAASE